MQGSFSSRSVRQFYESNDLESPCPVGQERFDFSRTAKSTQSPRVSVTEKSTKAEEKLHRAEKVLKMAEISYKENPTDENFERVCLAEKLLGYTEKANEGEMRRMRDKLRYSETFDSADFARCERPDGSIYGTRGKCRKGREAGTKTKSKEQSAIEQLSRILPKGEKIVWESGKETEAEGR